MQLKTIVTNIGRTLQKNSPYILAGLGAAGVISTAVMTAKAAVKAHQTIEYYEDDMVCKLSLEELEERGTPNCYISTLKEKAKLTWKYFIPPVIMGSTSIACIIGAQSVNTKRHAALASLYSLTESTLKDYREKVIEQIGEKKEQKIQDEITQEKIDKNPVTKQQVIITGKGEALCYDSYSGRYFKSDIETLRRIQNDFNHELMGVMWLPLNDLYCYMGLGCIKMGDDLGWTVDELLDFRFSTMMSDNGEPCLVVDFDLTPKFIRTENWGGVK